MSTKKKIVISMIAILTLVFGGVMVIHADGDTPSSQDLLSSGRIEVDLNSDNTIDAIFDAQDLKDIATSVENGKSSLATSINAYPNTNVGTLDTFANLSSAIDTITEIPDVYYYDKATEGVDCARYIYENGSYYPCDKYGVKTSDTALTGTITIVTKDDTTEAAEGEIQLVKYEKTGEANLSAGFAGYADKSFVLGSGADNITYRNQASHVYILDSSVVAPADVADIVGYKANDKNAIYCDIRPVVPNYTEYTIDNFIIQLCDTTVYSGTSAYYKWMPLYEYFPEAGVIKISKHPDSETNICKPYSVSHIWMHNIKFVITEKTPFILGSSTIAPTDVADIVGYKTNDTTTMYCDIRPVVPNYTEYTTEDMILQLMETRIYYGNSGSYISLRPYFKYYPEAGVIAITKHPSGDANVVKTYSNTTWTDNIKLLLLK